MRGVDAGPLFLYDAEVGLSPRVRGRLDQASPVPALFGGVSPRVRGGSCFTTLGFQRFAVYPRVYGVGSLAFTVFEVKREPYMQIAYLFPELIAH